MYREPALRQRIFGALEVVEQSEARSLAVVVQKAKAVTQIVYMFAIPSQTAMQQACRQFQLSGYDASFSSVAKSSCCAAFCTSCA
jgi:hypothetical protein